MTVAKLVAIAAGCLLAASAPAVAPAVAPEAAVRKVVLITLDTVRADKLGCYGYFRDTTPQLDRFATQCVRFARCLAPVSNTTPSHASMLTGVYPHEHGILNNFFSLPPEEQLGHVLKTSPTLRTFAQVVTAAGIKTGGFVAATPVKKSTGLAVGFSEWSEPPPSSPRRVGKTVVADGLEFLGATGNDSCFAWLHFFDVHGPIKPPLTPPTKYTQMYRTTPELESWMAQLGCITSLDSKHQGSMPTSTAHNMYDGCLRFLDDQLGPLLDWLSTPERRADTLVIVVGDHGHGLGQHAEISHGTAWDEQLRVPLLVRAPGVAPGVVETNVSTLDLLPTIVARAPGLSDATFAAQLRGRDLLAPDLEARPLIGITAATRPTFVLTTTRWKLLHPPKGNRLLFDLESDPYELKDVATDHPDVVAQLGKLLLEEIDRQERRRELHRRGVHATASDIDPQILEELRALGYVDDGDEDGAKAPDDGKDRPANPDGG